MRIRKMLLLSVLVLTILASAVVVKAMLSDPPAPPVDVDTEVVDDLEIDLGDFAPVGMDEESESEIR